MAVSTPDTSITLQYDQRKTDATVAVGAPTVGADDVAIWAGASVDLTAPGSIVATLEGLLRFTRNQLAGLTGATVYQGEVGQTEADFVLNGVPGASDVSLHVGANIIDGGDTRHLDSTLTKLRELWLEAV